MDWLKAHLRWASATRLCTYVADAAVGALFMHKREFALHAATAGLAGSPATTGRSRKFRGYGFAS